MNLTLSRSDIERLADRVEAAQDHARAIPKLTDDFPQMGLADGYAVQSELRRRRASGRARPGPRRARV